MPEADKRAARLAEGLCGSCGVEPRAEERTECEACLAKKRAWSAARRVEAARRGVCEACMRRKAARGRGRRCASCADKYLARQLARDRETGRRKAK